MGPRHKAGDDGNVWKVGWCERAFHAKLGFMWKSVLIYALALAAGAFALDWLRYAYVTRLFATEYYVGFIALGFTALGIWAGYRLTPRTVSPAFERNDAALKALGVTDREFAVLELLAGGQSNKEIARTLAISPNTVKSHILRLFEKLGAQRRTQAVQKAKELGLIR
ncbi:MAG TPA: response regulator transcription factor [Rhizomicrobium sp.]|nr:response regulator transcription factor [Rhizomicrobium sp.]